MARWPLQPLQPFQKTQLQPPVGPSVDSLCTPWFTKTNLFYRFPIFETSATALRGTTGMICFNRKRWEASPWRFEPAETEEWKLYQVKLTDQLAPMLMKIKQLAGEIARRRCLLGLGRHGEAEKCLYLPSSRFQTERFGDGSHSEFEAERTWAESYVCCGWPTSQQRFCWTSLPNTSEMWPGSGCFGQPPPDPTLCSCPWKQWKLRRLADCTGVRSRPRWFQRRDTPLHCLPKLTDGNGHEIFETWSFFGCERHVYMDVVSQHFLPTLFLEKPLRRSAANPVRPWVRQRIENVGKQKRIPCGSGSEGTYPCGAQVTMWWLNGHIKMRSFQTRPFQWSRVERPHLDFFGSHW